MTKGLYAGSFDPITLGHLDIIKRASKIVDELVVAVLNNSAKNPLFSVDNRVSMIREVVDGLDNVTVESFEGLTVDYAQSIGATVFVRGLRAISDFDYELQIAQTNRVVDKKVDTIFLATDLKYSYLSSTVVKEFASYGADISKFVPESIVEKVYDKYRK